MNKKIILIAGIILSFAIFFFVFKGTNKNKKNLTCDEYKNKTSGEVSVDLQEDFIDDNKTRNIIVFINKDANEYELCKISHALKNRESQSYNDIFIKFGAGMDD